jgi:hypothetical protein
MSDELRLPDELAACEARLAALPLAASRIDRDAVLYRAGWAACEAARTSPAVLPSIAATGARSRTVAAWSAASAALAASLAVAVTLVLQPGAAAPSVPPELVAQSALAKSNENEVSEVATHKAVDRRLLAQLDALASGRSDAREPLSSLGFLGALRDHDREKWDQPILVSTNVSGSADNGPSPEPMTARGLLEEYLPGAHRKRNRAGASPSGDVLKLLNPLSWSEDTI